MAEFRYKSNSINLSDLQDIGGSTPIKNYPGIQNANNSELKEMITTLKNIINERDEEIQKLKDQLATIQGGLNGYVTQQVDAIKEQYAALFQEEVSTIKRNLTSNIEQMFNNKMSEFEETYAKSSDVYPKEQINDLFITKTEADNKFVKKTNN